MGFRQFYLALDKEQRRHLAQQIGVTAGYLLLVAYGHKRASLTTALAIEAATGGLVKASDLYPRAHELLEAAGYRQKKEPPCTPEPAQPTPGQATLPPSAQTSLP
ncbi:MAG: helix-turn-helix domain-containing protein, partial [Rhodocyclaceae bacterium]|nr:helix-turn-helix domain-containing protein [Rhodocyclaceae bacterium]